MTDAASSPWVVGVPDPIAAARLAVLYEVDGAHRLRCSNEWERRPPPRLHVYRTPDACALLAAADVPSAEVAEARALVASEPPSADIDAPLACASRLLDLFGADRFASGPSWVLDAFASAVEDDDDVVDASQAVFEAAMEGWLPDVGRRSILLVLAEHGRARSVCASVRSSAAAHEAGLETAPDARGRGLATRVTGAWARRVVALGAAPCYSTDHDNHASRAVAAKFAPRLLGVDFRIA